MSCVSMTCSYTNDWSEIWYTQKSMQQRFQSCSLPIILNLLNIFLKRWQIHFLDPRHQTNDVIHKTLEAMNNETVMMCDLGTALKLTQIPVQIHEVIFYRVDLQIKEQN